MLRKKNSKVEGMREKIGNNDDEIVMEQVKER